MNPASLESKDCIRAGGSRSSTFFLAQLLLARVRVLAKKINIPQKKDVLGIEIKQK